MCYRNIEARSIAEPRERHRSVEPGDALDEAPDVGAVDDSADDPEEHEPPAEPRAPADD
ncbi:hypothetical protein [Halorubrum sp. N11]|uniref:hypothetical protein n=1 Tax=Halorubrum sp. N11 TaxID=3402276 RepID=UPI003EC085B0